MLLRVLREAARRRAARREAEVLLAVFGARALEVQVAQVTVLKNEERTQAKRVLAEIAQRLGCVPPEPAPAGNRPAQRPRRIAVPDDIAMTNATHPPRPYRQSEGRLLGGYGFVRRWPLATTGTALDRWFVLRVRIGKTASRTCGRACSLSDRHSAGPNPTCGPAAGAQIATE